MNGRGKPNSDYNFYLNGQTDPNVKGNNTPVIELRTQMNIDPDQFIYAAYHRNKTGSAPGVYGNGKYNDNRLALGYSAEFFTNLPFLYKFNAVTQFSRYEIGLTEDGVQRELTAARFNQQAKDLEKSGHFTTLRASFNPKWSIQYTYEILDRVDSQVWLLVANENEDDPSLNAVERSNIYSVNYQPKENFSLSLFFRDLDNPFPELSQISTPDSQSNPAKAGLVLSINF